MREDRDRGKSSTGSADEGYTRGRGPARDWRGWKPSVWTERMVSALDNGVKGGKWFSLIDKVIAPDDAGGGLARRCAANKGAAGVDGQSIGRFAAKADLYLSELAAALREGTYRPQAVKRVDIPKGDGRTRPLGIPTVKDRIVQQAVKLVIEPIFEREFCGRQLRLPAGTRVPGRAARGRSAAQGRLHLCGGRRPEELLRHDPARASDGAGRGDGSAMAACST